MPPKSTKINKVVNIFFETWESFWQKTNIAGLSNARTDQGWRRYVWVLIFALFTILTITGLADVCKDYATYPVTTSVTVEHHNQVSTYRNFGANLIQVYIIRTKY